MFGIVFGMKKFRSILIIFILSDLINISNYIIKLLII